MSRGGDGPRAELRSRYEALLGRVRNPARLIGGEPGAGSGFEDAEGALQVVLGFPDTYEIGIANHALQILYHLAEEAPGVAVERVYLPWTDVISELRREALPLLSLETWTPVREADILGLSLQHELNYTNVLELLDLSGIPLLSEERGDDDPLVIGGGPATANFLPMAAFFDAFVVGDAEEAFPELLRAIAAPVEIGRPPRADRPSHADRAPRSARLDALAQIEGVFVPGRSGSVRRRVVADLESAPYPSGCLVPLTEGVHDRAWVEVMRGCTRGCRFCQAGMWYRPVRERSGAEVLRRAGRQLRASGHEELALASLSTTDYTDLGAALGGMARDHPEVRINLPSLRVDSAAVRLGRFTAPSGNSITLAPEAGTQRMRDVINKNVTEEDVLRAVGEAYDLGYTTVKLYFMIGLPAEADEDVAGIVRLCGEVADLGRDRLGFARGRLRVHVSVSNFIPKPFTPFQWEAMAGRETLERRQGILREGLRGRPFKLSLHDIEGSYLEAALARGGAEIATVILAAWQAGARFDSWTEEADLGAWRAAFAETGRSYEERATTPLVEGEELPWDVIEGVVTRRFLLEERRRAIRAETTSDCREGRCGSCGACEGERALRLASPAPGAEPLRGAGAGAPGADGSASGEPDGAFPAVEPPREFPAAPAVVHALMTFSARGRARYLGHLDTAEALRRAVRRAGGRLALSAGMRPKPQLSLALPRGVGVEGRRELSEFSLSETPPAGFESALAEALPAGMALISLEYSTDRFRAASRVRRATYRVGVSVAGGATEGAPVSRPGRPPAASSSADASLAPVLAEAARRYTGMAHVPVMRERRDTRREIDVRRYVERVEVLDEAAPILRFTAEVTPRGTVRPEEVAQALAGLAERPLEVTSIERMEILLEPRT